MASPTITEATEASSPRKESHKKRKKPSSSTLVGESGMTEEERRALRQKQRTLHDRMLEDPAADTDQLRTENNALFQSVVYTREAVLDADNVDLLATKVLQKADRLLEVPRYDANTLISKLRKKCRVSSNGETCFDWRSLGRECGICFDAVPERVSFLAGAIDAPKEVVAAKVRQRRQKVVEDDAEEVRPELVQKGKQQRQQPDDENDSDRLTAGEKTMSQIKHILRKKCEQAVKENNNSNKDKGGQGHPPPPEIDGLQFLINPKSFTQTVENIFHFSFMIKKGEAGIGMRTPLLSDEDKGPPGLWVRSYGSSQAQAARQSVCSFTMKDWKNLCAAYELKEGMIPHRNSSSSNNNNKHAKGLPSQSSTQQSSA